MNVTMKTLDETQSKLYERLNRQILNQISVLKRQKADAGKKARDPKNSQMVKIQWLGMETAYSNALSELELAYERAHYSVIF